MTAEAGKAGPKAGTEADGGDENGEEEEKGRRGSAWIGSIPCALKDLL